MPGTTSIDAGTRIGCNGGCAEDLAGMGCARCGGGRENFGVDTGVVSAPVGSISTHLGAQGVLAMREPGVQSGRISGGLAERVAPRLAGQGEFMVGGRLRLPLGQDQQGQPPGQPSLLGTEIGNVPLFYDDPIIDDHSHNFCVSLFDWLATKYGWSAATETTARIDRLYGLKEHGVEFMAVSAMRDTTFAPGDSRDITNAITAFARDRHPDFFLPMAQVFKDDPVQNFKTADTPDYLRGLLEDGFRGVGELWVHAYGMDFTDTVALMDMCEAALDYDVPVQVHWEIGTVSAGSAATNFMNLKILLEVMELASTVRHNGEPFKLILSHCGHGPDPMEGDPTTFDPYKERIQDLLDNYPNVYFDVAGLQRDAIPPDTIPVARLYAGATPGNPGLTDFGDFIFDLIRLGYEDRFMIGIDTYNRDDAEIAIFEDSVHNYQMFLEYDDGAGRYLSATQKQAVRRDNAIALLRPAPMSPGP